MDKDLVERARAGDAEALSELLTQLEPSVYRFGQRMCGSGSDAEDVLQDTLLSVAQNLEQFEGRASLASWVFTLARSACGRKRRGLKNQPHLPQSAADGVAARGHDPEREAADKELAKALDAALSTLPEDQREVLWLRDVEGMTAPETAEAVGASVAAVKSRLHRARSALKEALSPVLRPDAPVAGPGCPQVAQLFSQKLEGELDPDTCARMESHLESCAACSAACDTLREALSACQNLPDSTTRVPPDVQKRVREALRGVVRLPP